MVKFSVRFYLRPDKNKNGTSLVYMDLKSGGQRKQLSMGISLLPEFWNPKGSADRADWVLPTHNLAQLHNLFLLTSYQKVQTIRLKSLQDGVNYTAAEIARLLFAISEAPAPKKRERNEEPWKKDFLAFAHHVVAQKSTLVSESRHRQMKSALGKLRAYQNSPYVKWSVVSPDFFEGFRSHLAGSGLKPNSVNGVLKIFSVVVNAAIDNKLLDRMQYMPRGIQANVRSAKEKLTMDQIERIIDLPIPITEAYYHARNMFLFQFYTGGTRISDVLSLTWQQIFQDKMSITQTKTGKRLTVSLTPKALEIIQNYRTAHAALDDYVFPYMEMKPDLSTRSGKTIMATHISTCTSRYNKQLKSLAKAAGINVVLTSHVARHSFASILATKGANIHQLSKALGHSSLKTTEMYLKDIDPEAVEAIFKHLE